MNVRYRFHQNPHAPGIGARLTEDLRNPDMYTHDHRLPHTGIALCWRRLVHELLRGLADDALRVGKVQLRPAAGVA